MRDGLEMRSTGGSRLAQTMQAANTPMMRLGLLEGGLNEGVLASGQVVGAISDIPTCRDLIERTVSEPPGR